MALLEFTIYIQQRMQTLNLSVAEAAQRSGISKQTWYKLRRADIKEAKLSTLIKVARTLETTTPHLIHLYFSEPCVTSLQRDKSRLVADTKQAAANAQVHSATVKLHGH